MTFRQYLYIGMVLTFAAVGGELLYVDHPDSNLAALWSLDIFQTKPLRFVPISIPTFNFDIVAALFRLATWQSPLWSDNPVGPWVRLLVLWPMTGAFTYGLVTTIGPVMVQLARAAAETAGLLRPR